MSLRDELLGVPARPAPRGFTLLVPPSWEKFDATEDGRKQLEARLRNHFRALGRPDMEGHTRSLVRRQWVHLERTKAFSVYMPMTPTIEGATPMTVIAARWNARGDFEQDVRMQAATEVERIDTEIGPVFRWDEEQSGRGDLAGVLSRQHNFVFPFPVDEPRQGILVKAAIVHPGVEEGGAALDAFSALAESIAETFRWRM